MSESSGVSLESPVTTSRRDFLKLTAAAGGVLIGAGVYNWWESAAAQSTVEAQGSPIPERQEVMVGNTKIVSFCQERFLIEEPPKESRKTGEPCEVILLDESQDVNMAAAYLRAQGVSRETLLEVASGNGIMLTDTTDGNELRRQLGMPEFNEKAAAPFYLPMVIEEDRSGKLGKKIVVVPPLSLLAENLITAERFVFPTVALKAANSYFESMATNQRQSGRETAADKLVSDIGYYFNNTFSSEASREEKLQLLEEVRKIIQLSGDPKWADVYAQYESYVTTGDDSFPGMWETRKPLANALMAAVETNSLGSEKDELIRSLARIFYFIQRDTDRFGPRSNFGIKTLLNVGYVDQPQLSEFPDFFWAMISRSASSVIQSARGSKPAKHTLESTLSYALDYSGQTGDVWSYLWDPHDAAPIKMADASIKLHIDSTNQSPAWFRQRWFLGCPPESLAASQAAEINIFGNLNWHLPKMLEAVIVRLVDPELVQAFRDIAPPGDYWQRGGFDLIEDFLTYLILDESNTTYRTPPFDMQPYRDKIREIRIEARLHQISQLFPQEVQDGEFIIKRGSYPDEDPMMVSRRVLPLTIADRINAYTGHTNLVEIAFQGQGGNEIWIGDVFSRLLRSFSDYIKVYYEQVLTDRQPEINEQLKDLGPLPLPTKNLRRWLEDIKKYERDRTGIIAPLADLRAQRETALTVISAAVKAIEKATRQSVNMRTLLPAAPAPKLPPPGAVQT